MLVPRIDAEHHPEAHHRIPVRFTKCGKPRAKHRKGMTT